MGLPSDIWCEKGDYTRTRTCLNFRLWKVGAYMISSPDLSVTPSFYPFSCLAWNYLKGQPTDQTSRVPLLTDWHILVRCLEMQEIPLVLFNTESSSVDKSFVTFVLSTLKKTILIHGVFLTAWPNLIKVTLCQKDILLLRPQIYTVSSGCLSELKSNPIFYYPLPRYID